MWDIQVIWMNQEGLNKIWNKGNVSNKIIKEKGMEYKWRMEWISKALAL